MLSAPGDSRAIGFRPWEISALINQDVVDQHAEEAAFLWTQRDHAISAPHYALKDLARLDERVEAHVDGLRVAKEAGWKTTLAQLEQGRGEVFAASVLAFESGDAARISRALDVGCSKPALCRGLISSLGWTDPETASREGRKLLTSQNPEIRRSGIAGLSIHRIDPDEELLFALEADNPQLAARSMRAAAELGRVDLISPMLNRFGDSDENCRYWAAWSTARLGNRYHSLEPLRSFALKGRGLDVALRIMPLNEAHALVEQLFHEPALLRQAVFGLGIIGDPAAVPQLLPLMENVKLSRAAGAAFSLITGVDLSYADLDCEPSSPPPSDDDPPSDNPDADYPWPDPTAVSTWWGKHRHQYREGIRYLAGNPVQEQSLQQTLAKGKQTQRIAAALELALLRPSQPLFETRAQGRRQRLKVAA